MEKESKLAQLTLKHQQFCNLYVTYWNGRKAYHEVYPAVTDNTARVQASKLLMTPAMKEAVTEVARTKVMGKDEVLARINAIAEINVEEFTNDKGDIDIRLLKKVGAGYMIKSISDTKFGKHIHLHDQFKALETLAKIHKMFDDNTTVTVNIENQITAEEVLNERLKTYQDRFSKLVSIGENSALTV